jgi:hypothetical protein
MRVIFGRCDDIEAKPWLSIKELLQANLHCGISTLLLPPRVFGCLKI